MKTSPFPLANGGRLWERRLLIGGTGDSRGGVARGVSGAGSSEGHSCGSCGLTPWKTTRKICMVLRMISKTSSRPSSKCWLSWKVGAGPGSQPGRGCILLQHGELCGWDRQRLGVRFLMCVVAVNLCLSRNTGPGAFWDPSDPGEPPPADFRRGHRSWGHCPASLSCRVAKK